MLRSRVRRFVYELRARGRDVRAGRSGGGAAQLRHGVARCGAPLLESRRGIIYHDRPRRARRQLCAGPAARSQNRDTAGQISFYYTYGVNAEGSLSAAERAPRFSPSFIHSTRRFSSLPRPSRSLPRTFDAPFASPTRALRFSSLFSYRRLVFTAPLRAEPGRATLRQGII